MDLANVDPDVVRRLDALVASVQWGGGALVVAICLRLVGGLDAFARVVAAIRGRG